MTLASQMTTDLAVFFNTDEHAQAVTYNGASITGIVGHEKLMAEDGSVKRQKVLWVQASDVAAPAYRDTVVIGSDTWYVGPEDEHEEQGAAWKLPLYHDERPIL
jgi:hypothetical protein